MLARIYIALAAAALIFLGFIAGYGFGFAGLLSGTRLAEAMAGARALYALVAVSDDLRESTRWNYRLRKGTGITINDPGRAYNGLTLYTSGHDAAAMLIDMAGNEVHRWQLPFAAAWPVVEHLDFVAKPDSIYWRKAVALPNGDLLALYDGEGVTPSGHGLVKIDRNSKLIWKYSETTHHDVRIGPDGNIYTLINTIRAEPVSGHPNVRPPILDDEVVILAPDGRELQRISVLDAFLGTRFERFLLTIKPDPLGDYFHTNSLQPLSAEIASRFDFAEPGHILISMRELRTIALLDPDSGKLVWAMHGPWIGQHDPDMLANGNILIFDNRGNIAGLNGDTRVMEFDPKTHAITWLFEGNAERRFICPIRSSQQRLPNGNTLITCSTSGQLFEVTVEGDIVWEFVNPVSGGENDEFLPIVAWGQRYRRDELPFLQN